MKLYKLTDEKHQSYNGMQWGPGVTHTATGERAELCSNGLIHAFEDPLLAVLLNPIYSNFKNPVLWEAETDCKPVREGQINCGVRTLTTLRIIPLPEVTTEQRVRFAILCALRVCKDTTFTFWAHKWLSGEDKSAASAREVAEWASDAERVARASDADWAVWAVWAAEASAARAAEASADMRWAAVEWAAAASVLPMVDLIDIAHRARTGTL